MKNALEDYKDTQAGEIGVKYAWEAVVHDIVELTNFDIRTAFDGPDVEKKDVKACGERLRRFVRGSGTMNGEFTKHAFEFLSHPDIGHLDPNFARSLISELRVAVALSRYQRTEGETGNLFARCCSRGMSFTTVAKWQNDDAYFYLELHPHTREEIFGLDLLVIPAEQFADEEQPEAKNRLHYRGAATLTSSSTLSFFTTAVLDKQILRGNMSLSVNAPRLITEAHLILAPDVCPPVLGARSRNVLARASSYAKQRRSLEASQEYIKYSNLLNNVYLLTNDSIHDIDYENVQTILKEQTSHDAETRDRMGLLPSDREARNDEMETDDLTTKFYQAIRAADAEAFDRYLDDIGDINMRHPKSNLTVCQMVAACGWRKGYRILTRRDDEIDYTLTDNEGWRASSHAMVHGFDDALAKLLRIKERKALDGLGPKL
ncbi:hypothetical protein QMT40_000394 [Parvibaculaceae bacterium PLY_AMNH_Bact1]|nr:hypothetical protein QMT40_000394 [Parvibaculaceae bacterium PLY_AMNH_Bact1]